MYFIFKTNWISQAAAALPLKNKQSTWYGQVGSRTGQPTSPQRQPQSHPGSGARDTAAPGHPPLRRAVEMQVLSLEAHLPWLQQQQRGGQKPLLALVAPNQFLNIHWQMCRSYKPTQQVLSCLQGLLLLQ